MIITQNLRELHHKVSGKYRQGVVTLNLLFDGALFFLEGLRWGIK